MQKIYLFIFFIFSQLSFTPIHAQELVLPFSDTEAQKSLSENGMYLTTLSENGFLSQVDVATGSIICTQKIPFTPGRRVDLATSYYGNFVMILNFSEAGFLDCIFYQFNGVEGFEKINNFPLESYNQFLEDGYYSHFNNLVIESNPSEDFIIKLEDQNNISSAFSFYIKFSNLGYMFYPYVSFSEIGNEDYGDIGGPFEWSLNDSECLIYDVSHSGKNVLMLSNYQLEKANPTDHQNYAYGIWNWQIKNSKTTYKRLFNDYDDFCVGDFCSWYSLEESSVYEMKLDEKNNRIYGHAKLDDVLRKICNDFHLKNGDIEFDEELYYEVLHYYGGRSGRAIPFVYDIESNQFKTVMNNIELTDEIFRENHTYPIPFSYDRRISFDLKYALYKCNGKNEQLIFYRLNLENGSVDSLQTQFPISSNVEISNDNKAIIWAKYDANNNSSQQLISLSVFDFNLMQLKSTLVISENKKVSVPSTVALSQTTSSVNLIINTSNLDTLNFNFDELPFFTQGHSIDDDVFQSKAFEDTVANEYWYAFQNQKFSGYSKQDEKYAHSYQTVIEYYIVTENEREVETSIPFNYEFQNYNMVVSGTEISKELENSDGIIDSGYTNLLYQDDFANEWHQETGRLFVQNYQTIDKYNPQTNSNEFVYIKHKSPIKSFDVLQNDSLMVSLSEDGEINIWNISSNKLLATLYLFDNGNNWVFVLPNNYYYGTQSAIERVAFAFDKIVFSMEFFELRYNRPDLVLKALGSKNQALINAYHQAYLKRLQKLGLTEQMLKLDYDIPYLHVTNKQMIPLQVDTDSIQIDLNLYDLRYNLDRINIWVNDVAIFGSNGKSIRELGLKFYKTSIYVPLGFGENKIQISAMNEAGAESFKETIYTSNSKGKERPDLYVVTIGVSKYADVRYNLTYAAKDAVDIATVFQNNGYFYTNVYTSTLLNEEVTLEQVAELKQFFSDAEINDQVIIFIAGHGVLDENFNYYFASHDMDFQNPSSRGIPYEMIEKLLDGIKPLKKLLLIDTCHSGEVDKDEIQFTEENESNENSDIVFRSGTTAVENKENQLGLGNTSELMKSLFTDLRKGTGATVISSAGGVEFAMESDTWQNGLFTYCLINGMTSWLADLNKNGEITVSELQNYVQTQVQLLSQGKQTPTSRIENQALDYRVW